MHYQNAPNTRMQSDIQHHSLIHPLSVFSLVSDTRSGSRLISLSLFKCSLLLFLNFPHTCIWPGAAASFQGYYSLWIKRAWKKWTYSPGIKPCWWPSQPSGPGHLDPISVWGGNCRFGQGKLHVWLHYLIGMAANGGYIYSATAQFDSSSFASTERTHYSYLFLLPLIAFCFPGWSTNSPQYFMAAWEPAVRTMNLSAEVHSMSAAWWIIQGCWWTVKRANER